jgi:N-acetylneuraminate synthase
MKVQFIAEVSSNHNGDLSRCRQFIKTARAVGCDGVKFQLFKIEKLFAAGVLEQSENHRHRKAWELPLEFIPQLAEYTQALGLQFSCTPFYLEAVEELLPYVDNYKIASYELLWHDLLACCARTGKPVILSTGMATAEEVQSGVDALIANGCRMITLLHCTSTYPTPPHLCNLSAIETMRARFERPKLDCCINFGWSDHSGSKAVISRAVHKWGASMIEFHLDLDGQGDEFKSGHCWLPEQIKEVIDEVNIAVSSDGDGVKQPAEAELVERDWRADPKDGLRPLIKIRKEWQPT